MDLYKMSSVPLQTNARSRSLAPAELHSESWSRQGVFPTLFTVCPLSAMVGVWGHAHLFGEDWNALPSLLRRREITTRVALYITMDSCTWGGRAIWQTSLPLAIKLQEETIHSPQQGGVMDTFFFLPLTKFPVSTIMICNHLRVNFTRW